MNKSIFLILFATIWVAACSNNSNPTTVPTILKIRAYIDGRSRLVLKGDAIYWRHLDFDAPGRWELGEASQPTYLNQEGWHPTWPDIPDTTNDSSSCVSSTYLGIPKLATTNQRVWLDIVQARERIFVVQQPNADNNFTLIIEFDDNYSDGADWYEVNLNYIVDIND